ARRIGRAAVLETAAGALAITVPFAWHRFHAPAGAGGAELGWLAWLVFAAGGGVLVGMAFLSVSRLRPAPADLAFALLAALLFGAGLAYAADLSPLAGLVTVPQGATALALGLGFFIQYGGVAGAAVLTTVVLGVAVAQLAAPPLVALALRQPPAPLTRAPGTPELSHNAPAEWPR